MSNRTQYENDLAALKTALTEMGQNAADAVEAAMEALCTADAGAAAAVVQGDGLINNQQTKVFELNVFSQDTVGTDKNIHFPFGMFRSFYHQHRWHG